MPVSGYRSYNLRSRIFLGFLLITVLSVMGTAMISYFILRNNVQVESRTEQQNKSEALMASLDYAVSHTQLETDDLPEVLNNELLKISDINKQDVVLYDLSGNYLMSNKQPNLVSQKRIDNELVNEILKGEKRIDIQSFDEKIQSTVISSYQLLRNNMLEPIAIVYFPYYHNDSVYTDVLNKYMKFIIILDLIIILISVWLSWIISKNLTNTLMKFSERINQINLMEKDLQPIRYYRKDELGALVKAYNRMILQIQTQRERLSFIDKEKAWREMAKQVAHEVKNPLTPMKLTIQNFERKFNPEDPEIREKVKKMSESVVGQIDLIATVASAFSQFAQLPEKQNEVFNLNEEMENITRVFNDENIFLHFSKPKIMVNMDKIYLKRIITNLVTNAIQAKSEERQLLINIDVEQINKRLALTIEDNGIGIPDEMFERIFEPNFTSKSSGMGLGLTMVRKMVEDCQGEITLKSEVEKGTKFIISLPTNM